MDGGEGHFAACFEKTGQGGRSLPSRKNERPDKLERQFLETVMRVPFTHYWHHNGLLYGMYHPFVKIEGKVLRQGVLIGESVKGRFEPAHAFFLSCAMTDSPVKTELDLEQADDFMHGRQISLPAPKGWRSLCWKGLPLGFGKSDGTVIKNKLPKGLRLMEGSHLNTHEV
jgi:NOL1/NOP2/fmu family ribosome biogenesis protein